MKRILSAILAAIMVFSMLPLSVFAEESTVENDVAVSEEVAQSETVEADVVALGTEVVLGDTVYYIEDGALWCSINNARPKMVCDGAFFVVANEGKVYYAVLDGFNTYIYSVGEEETVAKIFAPIDCFDIEGDFVYYSYNGGVTKLNVVAGEESTVVASDVKLFTVENAEVQAVVDVAEEEKTDDEKIELLDITLEDDYFGTCDINNLTFISNAANREYIQQKIDYYIRTEKNIQNMLNDGKFAYFFFEGGSDNASKSESDYTSVRVRAVLIVVKKVNGKNQVIYANENCSTIPDRIHIYGDRFNHFEQTLYIDGKNYTNDVGFATTLDGTYLAKSLNHGTYCAALTLSDTDAIFMIEGGYVKGPETGINVHIRTTIHPIKSKGERPWSGGCLLVADKISSYNKYVEAVFSGFASYYLKPYYSSKGAYRGDVNVFYSRDLWRQIATVTIDRQLARTALEDLYGNKDAISALLEYSDSKCENCMKAGTKDFVYEGEGKCKVCDVVYNYKATKTTDPISVNSKTIKVGTYALANKNKIYFRTSPYDWSSNIQGIGQAKYPTVEVLGFVKNACGNIWCEVQIDGKSGYVYSNRIADNYTYEYQYGLSQITISPEAYPTGTIQPKTFHLTGTISSKYQLYKAEAAVVNAATGKVALGPETVYPKNTNSLDIRPSNLNTNLYFTRLADGVYYLKYTVWDVTDNDQSRGNPKTWTSANFAVAKAVPNKENCTPPSFAVSNIDNGQRVTVTCAKSDEMIHVSTPWGEKTDYSPVVIDIPHYGSHSMSAWTTGNGKIDSLKVSTTVSVPLSFAPTIAAPQYIDSCVYVELQGNDDIYYTTDGSTPNSGSTKYSGPLVLDKSVTIKAVAMQFGYAPSDVTTNYVSVAAPDAPYITMSNANKIAQGENVFVSWNPTARAVKYTAYLMRDGVKVKDVVTYDTNATFVLDAYSDTENFTYTVYVVAHNSIGDSESNKLTVTAMHPLTVKFVDRILREDGVTDAVVAEIQENVTAHFADDRKVEGNVLSVQKITYGKKASIPSWEDKEGFSRQYFSEEAYQAIIEDTVAYAYYRVESYSVRFYDTAKKTQIGSTQKLFYSYGVTYPTDVELPTGCILTGWNVDAKVSESFTPDFADGDIKLSTVFAWENMDLPVVLEITGAKRANTCKSYEVNLKYTNNNVVETLARVIVTLYTADGKVVYTQTKDVDLREQKIGSYYTDTVTLDYSEKVSKISAVLVRVENDMTGGAVSEMKTTTDIELPNADTYWDKWSEWSEVKPDSDPGEKNGENALQREIEEEVWYSYRNKEYTESSASSLSGWESDGKYRTGWDKQQGPVYTNPQNGERNVWSEKYVTSSNYKTVYRYYRYADSLCATWGSSREGDYAYYYEFEYDQPLQLKPNDTVSFYKWCDCGISGGYHTVYSVNWRGHGDYPAQVWVSDNYADRWYYQDPIYTYKYWRWSDWSAWSNEYQGGDEPRSITVYRYRDEYSCYDGYDPSKDTTLEEATKKTYTMAGKLSGLTNDYSGKLATVLVYKKTNTDPTQEQLEYVDQIVLGTDNSYSFVVNPKHEIDYVDTGDYIVTLSIEGCDKLVNVDVIKAPLPTNAVTFQDADGNILKYADGTDVVVDVEIGGAVDVNDIPVPHKEGHTFVKWDKTLINVDENITVSPVFKKNTYNVVFVDHENETVELAEMQYGDYCKLPTVEPVPGKTFICWMDGNTTVADGDVITCNKILTAKWETKQYRVVFYDFNDQVVDIQLVEYGQSAVPPALIEQGGVVYTWDVTGDTWWNVTYDMIVYPFVPNASDVAAPMIDTAIDEAVGTFYVNLTSAEENGTIYYSYCQKIDVELAKRFVATNNSDSAQVLSLLDASEEEGGLYDPLKNIFEYTEEIQVTEGSVIYAFTVNENGEISPISVFQFGYSENEYTGETGNIYERDPSCPVIQIQNTSVVPGTTAEVPVTITNNPGLSELVLVFGYDAENLTLVAAENGTVFADNTFTADIRADGSCKFTWDADAVATADGTIATLTFRVGNDVSESAITVYVDMDMEENDDFPGVATENGVLNKNDVTVSATGDTNDDGDVDFSDAILILKHDVGLITLTAPQLACSDVNGDGDVDFSDAILILKYDVGLIDKIGK